MGDPRGFLKISRINGSYRPVCERVKDFKQVFEMRTDMQSREQAARCMDCQTPFCHWGCPLGNHIPEWNDYMFRGKKDAALSMLEASNNLPEITGRVCPAPCEYACVLGLNDDPVTIRENELAIIESGFRDGSIKPIKIKTRTGKRVAIVGSGPAGLACANSLNRAGHNLTVFEKDDLPGGILRYGIPDFKLEKSIIDRRIEIWKEEGVIFKAGINIGPDYPSGKLLRDFDAILMAGGSRVPRDLKIEGRCLKGIHFAMDYLVQANRRVAGETIAKDELIDAKNRRVVVIGGGDTGADCVGTAHRQGAACVVQIELLPKPAECRAPDEPWPAYPFIFKTASSHEEGGARHWSVLTKRFSGKNGFVKKLSCVRVDLDKPFGKGSPAIKEVEGSAFDIEADMAILAVGFAHPEHSGPIRDLGIELDERGNVRTRDNYMTSVDKIFCAGDMRRGQSLVVWSIAEGRRAAHFMDKYLMGETLLPIM